jgi:hypothetical protein
MKRSLLSCTLLVLVGCSKQESRPGGTLPEPPRAGHVTRTEPWEMKCAAIALKVAGQMGQGIVDAPKCSVEPIANQVVLVFHHGNLTRKQAEAVAGQAYLDIMNSSFADNVASGELQLVTVMANSGTYGLTPENYKRAQGNKDILAGLHAVGEWQPRVTR